MKLFRNICRCLPLVVMLGVLHPGGVGAAAQLPSTAQIIHANALLSGIWREDPQKATALATEAERLLANVSRKDKAEQEPRLHFRGTNSTPSQEPPPEGEILKKNQKDFDENPILREIYSHSPLASLRMLKRMREATEKNN